MIKGAPGPSVCSYRSNFFCLEEIYSIVETENVCVFSAFLNAFVTIKSPICQFQSIVKLLTASGKRGCLSLKRNGYGFGLQTSMFLVQIPQDI